MKKKHWNENTALTIIRITALINFVLIRILRGLSVEFRTIGQMYRNIPKNESIQDIRITLFHTIFVTDKTEYVSNNSYIIWVAVFLLISFLVMLVVLGLYFSSHDKRETAQQEMESDDSAPTKPTDE